MSFIDYNEFPSHRSQYPRIIDGNFIAGHKDGKVFPSFKSLWFMAILVNPSLSLLLIMRVIKQGLHFGCKPAKRLQSSALDPLLCHENNPKRNKNKILTSRSRPSNFEESRLGIRLGKDHTAVCF